MELTLAEALQRGISAHRSGNIQEADRFYTAVLKAQPGHPDANHNMGLITVSFNKAEQALSFFKKALDAKPSVAQYWLSYVDTLIKLKRFEEAEQILGEAKQKGVASEKLDALKAKLDPRVKIESPENLTPPQQQLNKLLSQFKAGRFGDAEELALSIIEKFPKHPLSWQILGAVLSQTGRKSEAVNIAQKSVALSPQSAHAHYNLGVILTELDRLEEAVESYNRSIDLKCDFTEAYRQLGSTLNRLGRLKEAEATYRKAIGLKPDFAQFHYNLGNILRDLRQLEKAEECYKQARKLRSDYVEAHSYLGNTLHELGKLAEAEKSHKCAILLKPELADIYYNLGNTLHELDRLKDAEKSQRQAISLKSNFFAAHNNLGNTLKKMGRLGEAEANYRHSIALNMEYGEAYNNLGLTLEGLGRSEEAKTSYRKAIALKPVYASAYCNWGVILQEAGRAKESEILFSRAIFSDQNFAEAFSNLGGLMHQTGKLEEAERYYKKAVTLKSTLFEARYNLGVLLFDSRRYNDAAKQFSSLDFKDSKSYLIRCSYLEDDEVDFYRKLDDLIDHGEVNAVIGSLVNCARVRYGNKRFNPFCNNPLEYVSEINLKDKYDFENIFVATAKNILEDKFTSYKDQGHLTNGVQTAGNIFRMEGVLSTAIEHIIRSEIEIYRKRFFDKDEGFIRNWPKSYELLGWLVSMTRGGELAAHMHDPGWITGSIYINVPPKSNSESGNIVLCEDDRSDVTQANPSRRKSIDVVTGSFCLFPASLHHFTVPFENEENRIVLAFDVLPKS